MTRDGESIQDTPEILHLHSTNDKKMDLVNSQKITSYDREAERSLSKWKNRESIPIVRYDWTLQWTIDKISGGYSPWPIGWEIILGRHRASIPNLIIPCRLSIDSMSWSHSKQSNSSTVDIVGARSQNNLIVWAANIQLRKLIPIRTCSRFDDDLWAVVVIWLWAQLINCMTGRLKLTMPVLS